MALNAISKTVKPLLFRFQNQQIIKMKSIQSTVAVLLIKFCALLPLCVLHQMGNMAGYLLFRFASKARKVTSINLKLCFPQLSPSEHKLLLKRSLQESAKAVFEAGPMWRWKTDKVLSLIHNEHCLEPLRDMIKSNQGVIVLSPHIGNWEVVGVYLSQLCDVTCMYAPAKLAGIDQLIYQSRQKTVTLVPATVRGVINLRKELINGNLTCILPDQQPKVGNGVFAPFFGIEALTMSLVSVLAKKTGAKVVCVYSKRLPKAGGYELVYRDVDEDLYSDDLDVSVAALNRSMEMCIKDFPEQYHWEYKRFSRQKNSDENRYKQS
jgi:KDO2-lipid IV(A) lauroyltransferase